jgi:hypothetical protein
MIKMMKIAKEKFPANILVALVIGIILGYFVGTYISGGVRGKAIAGVTPEEVLNDIENTLPKIDFLQDFNNADLCLIVNIDQNIKYFYYASNTDGEISAELSDESCPNEKDFVISYVSYDKFKEHVNNVPSFQEFRRTSDGTHFYVWPSKQILSGMKLADSEEFKSRFGDFMIKHFTQEEISQFISN